ncbi:Uncharacterized protein TPAR_07338 [Tolypocladium paradoxum]|uniref:Uncharacterized protein n=1 Tax=Tolypocladium paradoxum TaxID=94208 RepID=A0A2S4KQK0_9HYPO|nr:Uncharacterized protein TPAR_07338 [Tolypocladium paradoxum]
MFPSRPVHFHSGPPDRPNLSDQQQVYQALRHCLQFTRHDRSRIWVKSIVERNGNRFDVAPLLRSLGKDRVVNTAWHLLRQGIFASETKAKKRFPSLFRTPPESQDRGFQVCKNGRRPRLGHEIVSSDREPQNPFANPPGGLFAPPGSQAQGSQASKGVVRQNGGQEMFSFGEMPPNSVTNTSGGLFAPSGNQAQGSQVSEVAARPSNPFTNSSGGLFASSGNQAQGSQVSEATARPSGPFTNSSGGLFGLQAGRGTRTPRSSATGGLQRQDQQQSQNDIVTGPLSTSVFGFGNAMQAPAVPHQTPRPVSTPRTSAASGSFQFASPSGPSTASATSKPASGTSTPASVMPQPASTPRLVAAAGMRRPAETSTISATSRPASGASTPTSVTPQPASGTSRLASTPRIVAAAGMRRPAETSTISATSRPASATLQPASATPRPTSTPETSTLPATSRPASATKPASTTSKPTSTPLKPTAPAASLAESALQTATSRVPAPPRETTATSSEQAKHDSSKVPSLFPTYLPRKAQHLLLVHLQKVLEQACFDFGKQNFPEILTENKWDCAESVELNRWTELLASRPEFSGPENRQLFSRPPIELFTSVAGIRHAAVGRHNLTAVDLQERLANAVDLLSLLKDTPRVTELRKLQRDMQMTVKKLQRCKRILANIMEETVREAASKREEADRMEQQATDVMKKRDGEYREKAGLDLEQAIMSAQRAPVGGPDASMSGMGAG